MARARVGCHGLCTEQSEMKKTSNILRAYYVPGTVLKSFAILSYLILTTHVFGLSSFYRGGTWNSESLGNWPNRFIRGMIVM